MFEIGVQSILMIFCFQQIVSQSISPEVAIICLTIHMIIFFGSKIFIASNYIFVGRIVNKVFLMVLTFLVHPCFVLLLLYDLCEERNKITLIITIGCIGYSWQTLGWERILDYGILAAMMIIMFLERQRSKQQLELLRTQKSELIEALGESKRKIDSLTKHQMQIAYITKVSERNQMAQKLHDKLGHTLAGNIMRLEMAKIVLNTDVIKGQALITEITDHLREGMEDVRRTLRQLKPEQSELGLHTIKEILGQLESEVGIKTSLYYEGDLTEITFIWWQIIVDNLRETITNLKKYSIADSLTVKVLVYNKRIKVQFKDNGLVVGAIKEGLGLRGMEERTLRAGGKIIHNTDDGFETIMLWER